jgi:hypothetical protein
MERRDVTDMLTARHLLVLETQGTCIMCGKFYRYYCERAGLLSQYSDWLRAGRSGDLIPVGASFSAPVQTGHGAHPASCTMGTGYFPGVESGRGVTLTPHPLLVPRSKTELYSP